MSKLTCYAGAYLYESWRQQDGNKQKEDLLKALELKPRYAPARYYLATLLLPRKDYKQSQAVSGTDSHEMIKCPEYGQASELMGDCFRCR